MSRAPVQVDRRVKPIAGYPSLVAACVALADQGRSPEEIGQELDRDANQIRATLRRHRLPQKPRTIALPRHLLTAIDEAATLRGKTRNELATELLGVIVRDELFEALLGEPEGSGHA